jgi:hypothetical protein
MRLILTLSLGILANCCFAQITTLKVAPKKEQEGNSVYDSMNNFLGKDVFKYLGQELYVKGRPEYLQEFGYSGFYADYRKGKLDGGVFKCCDNYNSKYSELNGKYFKVLDVLKHPQVEISEYLYGDKFYLKLEQKDSGEIVYYDYDAKSKDSFPFIVVGYFQKQKSLYFGRQLVFFDELFLNQVDVKSGKVISAKTGQKWKCLDLVIEEINFDLSLLVENSLSGKILIPLDKVYEKNFPRVFNSVAAENYKNKFGLENFISILQGKIRIGMTKEMCKLSWGTPQKINNTITSGKNSEQWVYDSNYLYFENGKLIAIQ